MTQYLGGQLQPLTETGQLQLQFRSKASVPLEGPFQAPKPTVAGRSCAGCQRSTGPPLFIGVPAHEARICDNQGLHCRMSAWVKIGSRVTQSRLPLFPQQLTFLSPAVTSEKCRQQPTL
jgi:hypothetical protein